MFTWILCKYWKGLYLTPERATRYRFPYCGMEDLVGPVPSPVGPCLQLSLASKLVYGYSHLELLPKACYLEINLCGCVCPMD